MTSAFTQHRLFEPNSNATMNARFLTKTQFTGARLAIKAAQRTRSNMRMAARSEVGLFFSTSTGT